MKLLSFVIAFSCIAFGASVEDEANRGQWIYLENNVTRFMADMEIEWGVTYQKNDKTTVQKVISFGKDSELSMNTTEETITIEDSGNTLELNYKLDKGSYWIANVALMYKADTKTFPDAAFNGNVTLSGDMVNLFQSKENSSYLCTIESQTRLNSSEKSVTNAYLNFMPSGSAKRLQLQVSTFSANGSYDNASSCSWDTRDTAIDLQKYVLRKGDKDKTICAMVQTMLSLELSYNMINGKTMKTMIPVKTTTDVTGSCENENATTMAIALKDKVGTVTLDFQVENMKMVYYGDVQDVVMNSLQLEYDPATVYFPNHNSTGMQTVKNTSLCEFRTSMGSSYQCLALSQVMVTAELTASFNQTKIQAFGIKDGNFSKVDADCQAKPVMNTTTPAKTTQAPTTTTPFIPVPVDPTISERNITDVKNKTCLHGYFGLQLYITYNDTSGKKKEVTYNFDPQNITTSATCNDSNAVVKFTRNDDNKVEVTLQFMKTKSMSYLYNIEAKYDNKDFPKHPKDKTTAKDLTTMVHNFEVASNKSYHCSEGTDIFVSNADDFVALRMDGLILDVIPMKKEYSPASKCFRDVPQADADSANFFINNTESGKTYVCAAFTMTTNAMVMYPQLVDENMRTAYIEVPGNSDTSSDPSSGMCDEKKNITTLRIPLDDGKVVFFFVYKKQNKTMVLKEATLQYQIDSKYFPNHAHVAGNVSQSNVTLDMFPVAEDHSYKCSKNVSVSLVHGKIFMADVQVQPAGVDKSDGSFSAAKDCASDDLNPIIPIIVGAVLAGLVVIVLIAYVVGRKRNSASSYESL